MIRLSQPWSSGAVLQHSKTLRLYGQTTANVPLTVQLQHDQVRITFSGHSDAAGAFAIAIDAQPPSGPWTLRIITDNHLLQLDDLWFGELLLFAGQSNVGWPLARYPEQLSAAMAQLQNRQRLRCHQSDHTDFQAHGQWLALSPEHCARWPALLYHFSQCYQPAEADVMLGLVELSWPGSAIDAWTKHVDGASASQAWQPGALFAARLRPWLQQPFSALVWYQGEQDAMGKDVARYAGKLQHWLHSCRQVACWEFPLLLVQIAGFGRGDLPAPQQGFVQVRLAQQQVAASNPHCMLVSAADLGAANDIHPPFKAELARRLALCMRHQSNGLLLAQLQPNSLTSPRRELVLQLPTADWHSRPESEPSEKDAPIAGFYTDDGNNGWIAVPARFSADRRQLLLQLPEPISTQLPQHARQLVYGLMPMPMLTLYTAEGLPLLPQRWQLKTY
ncbi:sialate O-acetylesterase [Rheinheimera texasensis]|uniref:sialate O-acetylesterase n=1 Tax=Rheinheimera texasensis TaxID=306205 RepID=UPI0032B11769